MYSENDTSWRWVAPFGHLGINACSRLPQDFRSVPRPSSPPGAKASTRCPSLTQKPIVFTHDKPRTGPIQQGSVARRQSSEANLKRVSPVPPDRIQSHTHFSPQNAHEPPRRDQPANSEQPPSESSRPRPRAQQNLIHNVTKRTPHKP